jgi:ATP-dependent RNA helicase DeaD
MPTGQQICEKQLLKVIDDLEKVKVNEEEIASYMPDIYRKLDWLNKEDLIKRIVSREFNRFLDYYRDQDEIESPSESDRGARGERRRERGNHSHPREAESGYTRFFINMGMTDKFYARELISMINNNTHGKRIDIGRIDLMKNFSFFEVAEDQAKQIERSLNGIQMNGRKVVVEEADKEKKEGEGESRSGRRRRDERGNRDERHFRSDSRKDSHSHKDSGKKSSKEKSSKGKNSKKEDWHQFFE